VLNWLFTVLKPQPTFPGDNGRAVILPKEKEAESKELFKINQFNLIASDMMSLNRTLPDYRMDAYVLRLTTVFKNNEWLFHQTKEMFEFSLKQNTLTNYISDIVCLHKQQLRLMFYSVICCYQRVSALHACMQHCKCAAHLFLQQSEGH